MTSPANTVANDDSSISASPPYRQIRALHTPTTITVYQAYSASIAGPAVATQNLSASPDFLFTRMTWIKPSWNWMMYRSGYGFKDARQACILAITMRREHFEGLLARACVSDGRTLLTEEQREQTVRVQWDPERDVALQRLGWRSIQIGIGRTMSREWVAKMIVGIEVGTRKHPFRAVAFRLIVMWLRT
jgi:hypothetical protein